MPTGTEAEVIMPDQESAEEDVLPEVSKFSDRLALRQRIYEQLEPAVLALMRQEVAKAGGKGDLPWAYGHKRTGHA
jgi:hypothetical protein